MIAPVTQSELDNYMQQMVHVTLDLLKMPTRHFEMRASFIYATGQHPNLFWVRGPTVEIPGASAQWKLNSLAAMGRSMAQRYIIHRGRIRLRALRRRDHGLSDP